MRYNNEDLLLFNDYNHNYDLNLGEDDADIPFFDRNNSGKDFLYGYRDVIPKLEERCYEHNEIPTLKGVQRSYSLILEKGDKDIEVDEADEVDTVEAKDVFSAKEETSNNSLNTTESKQEVISSKTTSRKKTKSTEFSYLLERKAFRMMRKYYKEQFEFTVDCEDYKKRLPQMSQDEINALVTKFMECELKALVNLLSQKDYERTRDAIKTIVLCERYKKKEMISEGLNFSALRNVLHKYNTRNLLELLSDAAYSFLFTHFVLKNGRKAAEEQDDVDIEKLMQRMKHLMTEASNYLPSDINTIFGEISASLNL